MKNILHPNISDIQNPGSALGEAIGASMEIALNAHLSALVDDYNCRLISQGIINEKTGKATKLLLYDNFGTAYNIDAVITDESMQPLILMEYKYIRYKKHNRDKGSWLCTAHNAIRRRYGSVRSSIAVLAGNWSGSSLAMMKSHDVNVFIIPFDTITQLLREHAITFDWGEKDRDIAHESWRRYSALSDKQKSAIANKMIAVVQLELDAAIAQILDNNAKRVIEKITVEVHTNLGEVKCFVFNSVEDALDFLEDFSFDEMLNQTHSFTVFEKPVLDDE